MRQWLLFLLLVSPALIGPSSMVVRGQEDDIEDEDAAVEEEGGEGAGDEEEEGDDDVGEKKNVSPDADTTLVFTRPAYAAGSSVELPAGQIVEFLVGFSNKGESDFVLETLDASFRYPMDFTFHIQNFSAIAYQKTVKSAQEATVAYSFIPADAFAGRPIGLTINLAYRDSEGNFFFDPVFNETVQIVEFDEGFDTEVFFMYVMMAGVAILALFLVFSFASGKSKGKKPTASSKPVETGTANDDVDYEWVPRSALFTPGGSSKTSPRQRKGRKGAANASDTE